MKKPCMLGLALVFQLSNLLYSAQVAKPISVSLTNLTGFAGDKKKQGRVLTVEIQPGNAYDESAERLIIPSMLPEKTGILEEISTDIPLRQGYYMLQVGSGGLAVGEGATHFQSSMRDGDQLYFVDDAAEGLRLMQFPAVAVVATVSVTNGTKSPLEIALYTGKAEEKDIKEMRPWVQSVAPGESVPLVVMLNSPYTLFAQVKGKDIKGSLQVKKVTGDFVIMTEGKKLDVVVKPSRDLEKKWQEHVRALEERRPAIEEAIEETIEEAEVEEGEELP